MVVGLVLEEEEPGLFLAVHVAGDPDRAGVDLVRFVEVLQETPRLEVLGPDGREIHQAHRLAAAGVERLAQPQVPLEGLGGLLVLKLDLVEDGAEGGVAAVVAPIGVEHPDLGEGGLAALGLEIVLAEGEVGVVHREALLLPEAVEARGIEGGKALQYLDRGGGGVLDGEACGLFEPGDPGLDRVDHVLLDGGQRGLGQAAL